MNTELPPSGLLADYCQATRFPSAKSTTSSLHAAYTFLQKHPFVHQSPALPAF
jgi:hypothetical protein